MPDDYIAFCEEKLWCAWKQQTLSMPPRFDREAAPEPYLYFGADTNRLVALTTNPGGTMSHQRHAAVLAGLGPLRARDDYETVARKLGDFYQHEARLNRAARSRIAKLLKLSSWTNRDGVLQVEAVPFHSPSLPGKRALLNEISKGGPLEEYAKHLRTFLKSLPVVSPQAAPTGAPLGRETVTRSQWLTWIAKLAGLDLEDAKFVPLVGKGSKTTCAALVSFEDVNPKALVLMMGAAGLPGEKGLRKLAAALRES